MKCSSLLCTPGHKFHFQQLQSARKCLLDPGNERKPLTIKQAEKTRIVYSVAIFQSHVFKENSRLSTLVNTPIKNVNYIPHWTWLGEMVILSDEHAILKHKYLNFYYSMYMNTTTINPPSERLNLCHPTSSSHLGPNFAPSWNLLEHKTLVSTGHNYRLRPHQDKLLAHRKGYRISKNPTLSRYLYRKHIIWWGK